MNYSNKAGRTVSNVIVNSNDRPYGNIIGIATDGTAEGLVQPFTVTTSGNVEFWNAKTGLTYLIGTVSYISNKL